MVKWIPELYKYKHISFDLWLTLIKSHPEFKAKRNLLYKDFFAINKPIDEVAAVIRKFDVLTNSINEKVGRNFDTFEIYYLIIEALGIDIEAYNKTRLQEFYNLTETLLLEYKPVLLRDDIPSFFKQLHEEGKTTNILSNTAFIKGSSLRKVLASYGLDEYFTFQVYSDETGFSKPAYQMYEYAYAEILKTGSIAKHEVLHVGDNAISDYHGAINFGFNAHLIINTPINEPHLQPA
ncbi:phosphoglycolate phosphatase [Flavobacterium rivuli WB 3.3-2 = DSM 21788]|uniref:Phosphoglycolate phosphatase n=1 Tax=Flavobacterium rivuli WB 3.3-2 = DSM 21788 TaxID=1121895 RepID=A0A0A2M0W3_9FLAO|nr:HAD family hydrolase [Flavobacterium rivuli]KGO86267.1 phosphoglycolate phosphatase [Flavobacterium rivuli WB 3.3-2 = DSM 21788]